MIPFIPAITEAIGFAKQNLARILVYGALVFVYSLLCFFLGYSKGVKKLYEFQTKQATESVKLVVRQGAATEKVVVKYIHIREKAKPVVRTIEREVIRYAETAKPVVDEAHCLSPSWGVLHDAAAAQSVPDTTGRTYAAREAPTAAAAIRTVSENYAVCHETADQLEALQEWVREQHRLSGGEP